MSAAPAALLTLFLMAGCASEEFFWQSDDRFTDLAAAAPEKRSFRLLVAPVRSEVKTGDINRDAATRWSPDVDLDDLRQNRIIPFMRELSGFAFVGDDPKLTAETTREQILSKAWDEQYDFVLFTTVTHYEYRYAGVSTAMYLLNSFVWFWSVAPSWWIRDLSFQGDLKVKMQFTSVHSRNDILRPPEFAARLEGKNLSTMDRGWGVLDVFRFFGSLDQANWRSVHETLFPTLLGDVLLKAGEHLRDEFQPSVGTPDFERKMRKRMALAVSVLDYRDDIFPDSDVPRFKGVEADAAPSGASNLARTFSSDAGERFGYFSSSVKAVTNREATRRGIQAAIETFLKGRMRPTDGMVFYFSGLGAVAPGGDRLERYLLPYDADPENVPQSAISLSDLRRWLDAVPGSEVTVVLDCSFSGEAAKNSFGRATVPDRKDDGFLTEFATGRYRVLTAGSPDQGALELVEMEQRLLANTFNEVIATNRADPDRDGRIAARDAWRFLRAKVSDTAFLEGVTQTPELYAGGRRAEESEPAPEPGRPDERVGSGVTLFESMRVEEEPSIAPSTAAPAPPPAPAGGG
ncbi:MAG: hypothetical protein HY719_05215 [Planctomycetes bacterium]|nr:hypothetical protein [Planctomycetota bacterium]